MDTYALVFATMAFSFVMCILNARSIKKYTGYEQEVSKTFIKPLISAVAMGIVIGIIGFVFQRFMSGTSLGYALCLLIAVPLGALVYFVAIIGLKVFEEEELQRVPKGHLILKMAKKLRLL